MTNVGVAPRIVIDAPLPRSPLRGLLGAPGAVTLAPDQAHWQAGANIYPYPDAMPDAIDPCADGTFRQKLTPDGVSLPDPFAAFTAYLGEICHSAGIVDWDSFRRRADVALAARTSWALERQLAWGFYESDNPFLADTDVDLPAGAGAVASAVALGWLEGYISKQGQQGVIHLTPEVASVLGQTYLYLDGQQLRVVGTGTPVIVGQGYSDQAGGENFAPDGGSEAAGGQSWCFASSPIVYRAGEIISLPDTLGQALDRTDNAVVYRAERDLWVGFDGGPHAAVLADWSP